VEANMIITDPALVCLLLLKSEHCFMEDL